MNSEKCKDEAAAMNGAVSALRDFLAVGGGIACEAGHILMRQGEDSDKAFLLEDGSVLVYSETSYGTVPLATIEAPSLIGEIGVLANIPRTASVRVLEPAKVLPVSRTALLEVAEKAPAFLLAVVEQLGRQLDRVNKAISLYANALNALERREFDSRILDDLRNPTAELQEFEAAFRRFAGQILDKRRFQDEMASAALIQQSMLPSPLASKALREFVDLHAEIRPSRHVGGDFYDFFMVNPHRLAIAIGDVCGKGIPASLFMAMVVMALRTAAKEGTSVASTIKRANEILCSDNAASMFATLFFGVVDLRTGFFEYCNCGHLPPIISSPGLEPRCLSGSGLPVGLFPDYVPQVQMIALDPEDRLVLFTDGITEAMSLTAVEFGEERLEASIRSCCGMAARDLVLEVVSEVQKFTCGAQQSDDITCLALQLRSVEPSASPREPPGQP